MSFTNFINTRRILFALVLLTGLCFVFPTAEASAQRRDHLTPEEIEIVRDVQSIDFRMIVFIKAIERRLMVLDGPEKLTEAQIKRNQKDLDKWGELPTGTQSQLYFDINRILDESISKLEDVASREPKNELLPIALHIIADRVKLYLPRFEKMLEKTENRREIALLNGAIKHSRDIVDASVKFPRPEEKALKKRTKKIGY